MFQQMRALNLFCFCVLLMQVHSVNAQTYSTHLSLNPTALNMQGMQTYKMGYYPIAVKLSSVKPAGIQKEPIYLGKPLYGEIRMGNGPKSLYYLVLDPNPKGDYRIYIDSNQNGNLADDGTGAWSGKNVQPGRVMYGVQNIVLRASWGTPAIEKSYGNYGVGLYCFAGANPRMFMFREAARTGTILMKGIPHKALLCENDTDALFNKIVMTDAKGMPVNPVTTNPVNLIIDEKDDGSYNFRADIRTPFKMNGNTYEAIVSPDAAHLKLMPTDKPVGILGPPPPPPLLASGVLAPDFKAVIPDGASLQLSDYKGKVVILDFWATWCGPCQESMPHLEHVFQSIKGKNIAVIGLCVFDEKAAFDEWVKKHSSQYTFTVAYDPAGRSNDSVAAKLYHVSGIPTTYILDKDGKVAASLVGYGGPSDHRLEAALKKLQIETESASH